MLIRALIHHVSMRCKEGSGLAVCSCRESIWVMWIIIGSYHVLLHSSFVEFLLHGLSLSSFSFYLPLTHVLNHLLFMPLLPFFSPLLNSTLSVGLVRRCLREGQMRLCHHDILSTYALSNKAFIT